MLDENEQKVIDFIDNIIYYRAKKGETSYPYLPVRVVKKDAVDPTDNYVKNRKYFEQSNHLCKLHRIASLLLLKIYQNDDRFVVAPTEQGRIEQVNIECTDHLHLH
jgi:hypothetical protein